MHYFNKEAVAVSALVEIAGIPEENIYPQLCPCSKCEALYFKMAATLPMDEDHRTRIVQLLQGRKEAWKQAVSRMPLEKRLVLSRQPCTRLRSKQGKGTGNRATPLQERNQ